MLPRILEPETLDQLAPDDPAARRARRDLRRVNRVMGAHGILVRALARVVPATPDRPLRILEIGCGDGLLMLAVARTTRDRWPGVRLTLLDRQPLVTSATIAAYADAGWHAETMTADVLAWAGTAEPAARWDVVAANLFLHHFADEALAQLLGGCARRGDALVACEPRRSRFALAASHLIFFLGASAVTRRDGVLSVRAGFLGRELSRAWPADPFDGSDTNRRPGVWELAEYDDGLFTHCFCAARRQASA